MRTVAHDDVFALADNLKSCLFERLYSAEMIDAGNLRHLLNRHFHFAHVGTTDAFGHCGKIILNGVADVLYCFLLSVSLRPATRKRWAIHRVTLFRLMKHDLISKAHLGILHRERPKSQRTLCRPDLPASPQFQRWRAFRLEFTRRGGQSAIFSVLTSSFLLSTCGSPRFLPLNS